MRVLFKRLMFVMLYLALAEAQPSEGQPDLPMERVHSIDENYGIYEIENVTQEGGLSCECQSNFTAQEWSEWSPCQGRINSFSCHQGLRYRIKQCSEAEERADTCVTREWRYCYHQESCTGNWVEWIDSTADCTRPCGGGFQAQIRICRRNREIGLFCESSERRPYDVMYVPCNTEPCDEENTNLQSNDNVPFKEDPKIPDSTTTSSNVVLELVPNLTTWIAAGMGGGLLVLVIITAICICQCQTKKIQKRSKLASDDNENNFQVIDGAAPPQRASTLPAETNLSFPKPPPEINLPSRSSSKNLGTLPQVPPLLHHSFNNGKIIPSENVVYTLPNPHSSATDSNKEWQEKNNLEVGNYMESSTPFCTPGSRQCSTKDHPMCMQAHPFPDDGYLETSNPPPYSPNNKIISSLNDRRPTVDCVQTSTFGAIVDLSATANQNQIQIAGRPESHVYADIPSNA